MRCSPIGLAWAWWEYQELYSFLWPLEDGKLVRVWLPNYRTLKRKGAKP